MENTMNHGKLIQQFGKLVEQGNPVEKCVQVKTIGGFWNPVKVPSWCETNEYRVALRFVEGKPVFEGDELYDKQSGTKWNANTSYPVYWDELSWNPPKSKEVTITISRECAEYYADNDIWIGRRPREIHEAAKRALKNE